MRTGGAAESAPWEPRVCAAVLPRTDRRAAMTSFADHIAAHWPATDEGDLHECNLALHLAHGLAGSGALVYQEVYVQSSGRTIDLLAIDLERGCAYAVEAKRLKAGAELASLADQADRLSALRLSSGTARHRKLPEVRCHAVLLSHAWYASGTSVADWWNGGAAERERPSVEFGADRDWQRLRSFLGGSTTATADLTVQSPSGTSHTAMIAVRPVGPGQFWRSV